LSQSNGNVAEGKCAVTSAGSLKSNFIIHAVLPDHPPNKLANYLLTVNKCFMNVLQTSNGLGIRTLGLPQLSNQEDQIFFGLQALIDALSKLPSTKLHQLRIHVNTQAVYNLHLKKLKLISRAPKDKKLYLSVLHYSANVNDDHVKHNSEEEDA